MTTSATRGKKSRDAEGRMTLREHFSELRRRLFFAGIGLLAGAIAGWFLSDPVLNAMRQPIADLAKEQHRLASLNFDNITGAFDLKMQIAVTIGVVISSPVWLYQFWAFFVPALTRREIKYGLGFFLTAVPLFLAGCASGWFVVPHIVTLLTSFAPGQSAALIQAQDYFNFILKLVLAVGIAYVVPVFIVLLNFVGVLKAVLIRKSWRIAMLMVILFTAVATPSADIVSMFILAVPMAALFWAAAGVAELHDRRKAKEQIKLEAEWAAST